MSNEQQPAIDHSAAVAPASGGRKSALTGVLALFVSLTALLLAIFIYHEARQGVQAAAAERAEFDRVAERVDRLTRDLDQARSDLQHTRDALSALEQKESANSQAIAGLAAVHGQTNLDWALAEIEYLLVIAAQRLQLLHDVPTALAAMDSAAARLQNLDDAGLTELRAQLATDMDALQAVKDVDITGLSLYLTDLAGRVDSLPLGNKAGRAQQPADRAGAGSETGWRGVLLSVWREFKSLVVITRTGPGTAATLLPEERYFLYQNLRLQVESTRLAVLRRDTRTFHATLATQSEWLRDYFDTSSAEVANILESFARMRELDLDPDLPDLNSSMETLRAFVRGRVDEEPAVEPAEPPP